MKILFKIIYKLIYWKHRFQIKFEKSKLGYCGKNVKIEWPNSLNDKIFLEDDVYIYGGAKFIIGNNGKFIMKHHAGASQGLTVVTGKHGEKVGSWFHDTMWTGELDVESTVVVCEDARLGVNVTLMPNVTIGRGAQIGAGAIVTKDIPPYAVAVGNPARVIKFVFTPNQIIEHEKIMYSPKDRMDLEYIVKIQNKYIR